MSRGMIPLRPHHVLCSIGYVGEGYDAAFTANMGNLVQRQLNAPGGERLRIRIASAPDTICAPCPLRRGDGCAEQAKVTRLDTAHLEALGLREGDIVTWGELLDRAAERVQPGDLDTICEGCCWLASGVCKSGIAALKARRDIGMKAAG